MTPLGGLPNPPLVSPTDPDDFTAPWGAWFSTAGAIIQDVSNAATSTQRPTTFLYTGKTYFDTTLGLPIWWNGAAWVDATGTPV